MSNDTLNNPNIIEQPMNEDIQGQLQIVLSDHFERINQPTAVSLGLHLKDKTVEDVVNLLRANGIDAVPFYDKRVQDDLSCFIVDGTGIRSPFFEKTEETVQATKDMFEVMSENSIETSRALPITKANLVPAVSNQPIEPVIDVSKGNPETQNYISSVLNYTCEYMNESVVPDEKSKTHLYHGGLNAEPYAITSPRRYRDCVYGTKLFSEAIEYSKGSNKGSLTLKEIDGKSYGFIVAYKNNGQECYDMAGAERPFASRKERGTEDRPENRADYETPILEERNPVEAVYLRIDDKIYQIADENGYFKKDGIDFEEFAKLHKPSNTTELNDYMVCRNNKQIEEFPTFSYQKQSNLEPYQPTHDIKGYAYQDCVTRITEVDGSESCHIKDASLTSLELPEDMAKVHFTGNFALHHSKMPQNMDVLDLSQCDGICGISDCDLSSVQRIIFPKNCDTIYLSNVTFAENTVLDFSQTNCSQIVFEDQNWHNVEKLILTQQQKDQIDHNRKGCMLPEKIELVEAMIIPEQHNFTFLSKPNQYPIVPNEKEIEASKILALSGRRFNQYGQIHRTDKPYKDKKTYTIEEGAELEFVLDEYSKTCMVKCQDKLYPLFDEKNGKAEFVDTDGYAVYYDARIPVKEGEEPIREEIDGKSVVKFGKNHEYTIPFASENGEYYTQMKYETGGTINIPFPGQKGFEIEENKEQNDAWVARIKNAIKQNTNF